MQRALAIFFFGLLVGTGFGFALFSMLTPGSPSGPSLSTTASALPASAGSAPLADPQEKHALRERPGSSRAVRAISDGEARDLIELAGARSPANQKGSGMILGKVSNHDGKPLSGVTLRAEGRVVATSTSAMDPSRVGGQAPELVGLVDRVRDLAQRHARSRALIRSALTGADGTFRLEELPAGTTWLVRAYKQDWVIQGGRNAPARHALGSEIELEAQPVIELLVSVTLEGGAQPGPTTLVCTHNTGTTSSKMTYNWWPTKPKLRLTPGAYRIEARAGEILSGQGTHNVQRKWISSEESLLLIPGEEPKTLQLVLAARSGIHVQVTHADRDSMERFTMVHLVRLAPEEVFDPEHPRVGVRGSISNGSEDLSFLDLEPGSYVVWVSHKPSDRRAAAYESVEVQRGIHECSLEVPLVDTSRFLAVTATDPGGRKLESLSFNFRHELEGGSNSSSGSTSSRSMASGVHLITVPEELHGAYYGGGQGGRFSLDVGSKVYGSRRVDLVPGQSEVSVQFSRPGSLTMQVAGGQQVRPPGMIVVVLSRAGRPELSISASREPATGREYVIAALEPGTYDLQVQIARENHAARNVVVGPILWQQIEIRPGANAISLDLPALYELPIRIPIGDKPAGTVTLRMLDVPKGQGGMYGTLKTGAEERIVVANLPAGRYSLSGNGAQLEVSVPSAEVLLQRP